MAPWLSHEHTAFLDKVFSSLPPTSPVSPLPLNSITPNLASPRTNVRTSTPQPLPALPVSISDQPVAPIAPSPRISVSSLLNPLPPRTRIRKQTTAKKTKTSRKANAKRLDCPHEGCNVKFRQPSAVRSHVRTVHQRVRRFKCPEKGCNKRFGASGDVSRHVDSVHKGHRESQCPRCGMGMSRNTVLYRHMRSVHNEEPNIELLRMLTSRRKKSRKLREGGLNSASSLSYT